MQRRFGATLLCSAALVCASASPSHAQDASLSVDVEIVLAADSSQSLDFDEHKLQRNGYVEAFRSKETIEAMLAGPRKRIAVTYMEWAGDAFTPIQTVPWTVIDSEATARSFADRLAAQPIHGEQRTSISTGLYEAARLIEGNAIASKRQVVNISSDGANAVGPPVEAARDDLVRRGIVINALPIMLETPKQYYDISQLDRYYEQCVIGGQGAFVAPLTSRDQIASALRRALLEPSTATPPAMHGDDRIDCMAGEKAWAKGSRG